MNSEPLSREQVDQLERRRVGYASDPDIRDCIETIRRLYAQLAQVSSCHCCGKPIVDQHAFVKCPACDAKDCGKLAQVMAERDEFLAGQRRLEAFVATTRAELATAQATIAEQRAMLEELSTMWLE